MRDFITLLLAVSILICSFPAAGEKAVLVHNTLSEIKACKGRLKLKLVRIWGGDEENDEKKFFKTPVYLAVDERKSVYISDTLSHHIKVFDREGKYLRTIGRKGQGPGDTHRPHRLAFSPEGDLVVDEGYNRLQYFSPSGKSKRIIKTKQSVRWFGITSQNQLLVHMFRETFKTRTLVFMLDEKGKPIKNLGVYHDTAKNDLDAEKLFFALDGNDNIFVTNQYTPVIRKYDLEGKMTMVITYDTPVKLPVDVNLNQKGDEVEIKRPENWNVSKDKITSSSNGVVIERVQRRGIIGTISRSIGIDVKNRIYLVTLKRDRTVEELKKIPDYQANLNSFKKTAPEQSLNPKTAHLKILVFNPQGKVIAEAPVTDELDGFIVSGNRLYITDPLFYKRIMEYEIQLEEREVSRGRGGER
jgi:hypothetical protein